MIGMLLLLFKMNNDLCSFDLIQKTPFGGIKALPAKSNEIRTIIYMEYEIQTSAAFALTPNRLQYRYI